MHFFLDSPYKLKLNNVLLKMTVDGTLQFLKNRWTHNNDCKAMVCKKFTYYNTYVPMKSNKPPIALLPTCSLVRIP